MYRGKFPLAVVFLLMLGAWGCGGKGGGPPAGPEVEQGPRLPKGTLCYNSGGRLMLMYRGENPEALLDGAIWFPAVSPDCSLVAFWEDRGEVMMLSVMNLTSRQITKIGQWATLGTLGRNMNLRNSPCWRDQRSDKIYFADGRQIWQVDADGQNLQTVYEHASGGCYSVSVSPDANQFAFVGVNDTDQNLWIYSVLTHAAAPITEYRGNNGLVGAPAWSPKGDKIAFVLYKSDEANVWMVLAKGGGLNPITIVGRTNSPCWEPKGQLLAVSSANIDQNVWQIKFYDMFEGRILDPPLTALTSGSANSPSVAGAWTSTKTGAGVQPVTGTATGKASR